MFRSSALPAAVFSIIFAAAPAAGADFYVAPGGDDANPGTEAEPFATLARARDAARGRIAAGLSGDLSVLVRGGTYRITEPIVFGPEDGGTEVHRVTYAAYPGEVPGISASTLPASGS